MPARQGALAPGSENAAARSGFGRAALAAAAIAAALALSAASGTAKAHAAGGHAKTPITTEARPNLHAVSRARIRVRPPARPPAGVSARIRPPAQNQPRRQARPAAGRGFPPLFGSSEVRLGNIGLFRKWTGAFDRATDEELSTHEPCNRVLSGRCIGGGDWTRFLVSLAGKAREVQIEEVNRYVNMAPYLPDLLNYGARDYWATPVELFARGGDCEDYAIAKFVALRALGFSNSRLRLVVVQDLRRRRPHAVSAVNVNDRALVLDNQLPWIVPAEALGHYRPFYSVNEENLWRHPA
ncbi:MAG: transglutaminase-like cysteine peptidase [Alphaproteobacteria bacterium]|nr:transglutaminase-like cysteine peptidase [Alphaproteobacteria bacterium]